ncbi:nucleotidyltransferase substrate binding protein [Arachidicoccus soli]|uniref:Nucleotidyltransferase n=1 Tax=Arachidicoccus soli TaxID=2341117 RepID=A0A386HKB2_9BACT|nr:nucleotidyltransferase substrate binding protein [Arachidicoccus soli]AYD46317.1 nucleotidyltransferase [Arachidicoccus soli]
MDNEKDIRWKQRFQNFETAIFNLQEAVHKSNLSDLEKAGVIQFYEFTFELAWKTLKDYLEEKDVQVQFPRDTIKESFLYQIITEGDIWMDMLQKRNLMSHTYNKENAEIAYRLIVGEYFDALYAVYLKLKTEV